MTIRIGEITYKIRTPADLDDRLLAATGCNAAETARMLAGNPLPSHLGRALHPFVHVDEGESPHASELAAQIAAAADDTIAGQVRALYSAKPAGGAEPSSAKEGRNDGQ